MPVVVKLRKYSAQQVVEILLHVVRPVRYTGRHERRY